MDIKQDSSHLRRILIVDDEPNIISAVTRELENPPFGGYQFEVEAFTSPLQALDRAKQQDFDLVVSDYRMPEMDGLAFLRTLLAVQPDCAPIVLSGRTDTEALIKMVNQSNIFRFIPKPWRDYFLKGSIFQALDYYGEFKRNRRLANLIRQRNLEIPPLLGAIDHLLVVGSDEAAQKVIARALTNRSKLDDLYAKVYAEMNERQPASLAEDKLSVQISTSLPHALKMADQVEYSCIIVSLTSSHENNIRLLQDFSEKQPVCARLLIRGDMGRDDLVNMIDLARVNGIVNNPANEYEMKTTVSQALMRRRLILENRFLADMLLSAA